MSDTPNRPEDAVKLLDNGWIIMLRAQELGSYAAVALRPGEEVADIIEDDRRITDDFTIGQVLYRLTEKVTTGRIA